MNRAGCHGVSHGACVDSPADEQLLEDRGPLDVVLPGGRLVLKSETPQQRRPITQQFAIEKRTAQVDAVFIDVQHFHPAREHHHSPHRRQRGGDERAVITTCVDPRDGAARVSADAVGQQPFVLHAGHQLAVRLVLINDIGGLMVEAAVRTVGHTAGIIAARGKRP